jgi:hypothetical protein
VVDGLIPSTADMQHLAAARRNYTGVLWTDDCMFVTHNGMLWGTMHGIRSACRHTLILHVSCCLLYRSTVASPCKWRAHLLELSAVASCMQPTCVEVNGLVV